MTGATILDNGDLAAGVEDAMKDPAIRAVAAGLVMVEHRIEDRHEFMMLVQHLTSGAGSKVYSLLGVVPEAVETLMDDYRDVNEEMIRELTETFWLKGLVRVNFDFFVRDFGMQTAEDVEKVDFTNPKVIAQIIRASETLGQHVENPVELSMAFKQILISML